MSTELQSAAALVIVAFAVAGLLWRQWARRKKPPGCGGDCACPSEKFRR